MERIQQYLHKVRKLLDITFFRVLFFILLGMLLYAILLPNVKPEKVNLHLFSVANKTIRSPITIEDKESTEAKRQEAMAQVDDVYIQKTEYTQNRVDLISSIFDLAQQVNAEVNATINKQKADGIAPALIQVPTISDKVNMLKAKLTTTVTKDLSDQDFSALVQADTNELSNAKDLTVTAVNSVMSSKIFAGQVDSAKSRVEEGLKASALNSDLKNAVIDLGRYAIIQNEFYDPEATNELRNQASQSVEPVKILQGQIIVQEGELVTLDVYRQLKLVGLLDPTSSFKPYIGLGFFILLFMQYFFL